MFLKFGDGKIVDVLDESELTDEQKNAVKKVTSFNVIKKSNESTDSSKTKKSGS